MSTSLNDSTGSGVTNAIYFNVAEHIWLRFHDFVVGRDVQFLLNLHVYANVNNHDTNVTLHLHKLKFNELITV